MNLYGGSAMNDIIESVARAAQRMDAKGWTEGTGGNISVLADGWSRSTEEKASFPLTYDTPELEGRLILISRSGCRICDIAGDPERELALLRIEKGRAALLWGLRDGGKPSSELAAHLMSHAARLSADPEHHALAHMHATHVIAAGMLCPEDEYSFTGTLWSMCTEALMFLPDGVGILPWMPCGTDELGKKTAEKLRNFSLVLWQNHGVFASGKTPEEAVGKAEIADKAAELFIITRGTNARTISREQLRELSEALGITAREGWL